MFELQIQTGIAYCYSEGYVMSFPYLFYKCSVKEHNGVTSEGGIMGKRTELCMLALDFVQR